MTISSIRIEDGCIHCWACADICPEVFQINQECRVLQGADFDFFRDWIRKAADVCPVGVIQVR